MWTKRRTVLFGAFLIGVTSCSQSANKALLEAIEPKDTQSVEQILAKENVDFSPPLDPDSFEIPLAFAAAHGNLEIVRIILDAGADIDGKVSYSDTPLAMALVAGNRDITRYLIDRGADVNSPNDFAMTPFIAVCSEGDFEFAKLCIEHGGKINQAYPDKTSPEQLTYSPLQMAVAGGAIDVVKLLLERGGDPLKKDAHGKSCLDIASEKGHQEILEFLQASITE